MKYTYYKGGATSHETVEFKIKDEMYGVTTCVVNVRLLMDGVKTFPCGSGADHKVPPQQRLEILEVVAEERKRYTEVDVKTAQGWRQSGIENFGDYCRPGDLVDEEIVEHFVNCVPPHLMRSTCTQAGEEYSCERDPETGRYRPTYTTFHREGENLWRYDGECFHGENVNRVKQTSQLMKALEEARKETETR